MAFDNVFQKSLENIALTALRGEYPLRIDGPKENSLFGSGILLNVGTSELTSDKKLLRSTVSASPKASILVKKKFFSGFKHSNDLQWMDKTEKFFLRSVKALFAYKVAQLRAYESLTKLEDYFREHNEVNLNLFVDAYNQAQVLSIPNDTDDTNLLSLVGGAINNSLSNLAYDEYKEDILKILKRNAFSSDIRLTTWIVDPTSTDNYGTGPGTGVIEIANVSSFTTGLNIETQPSNATFSMVDPYRMMNINDEDIEVAIGEALLGSFGIFEAVINGETGIENIDTASVVGAGLELLGLGQYDSTIDVNYIRNRLRTFFIGKTLINPGDTVNIFIKSGKGVHETHNFVDEGYYEIDETMLEAERNLFTNKKLDLATYKSLRKFSDNSFGMRHVFAGVVLSVEHQYGNGSWTTRVDVSDNMAWLQWSRYMREPAISDPQGILEDPLTPYVLEKDASGRVLSTGGTELLSENKQLIKSGLLVYDSGILNGQFATEGNLLQGQYNSGGSLRNKKILQHPNGLIYRWKTGIITATAAIGGGDSLNEDAVTSKLHSQVYALQITQGVLNNLDIANILSILIVGQPYNTESFIQQAHQAHSRNESSSASSLAGLSPLTGVLDVIRRQNKHFGNFRPYRMITLSNRSMNESFSSSLIRDEINSKLIKLRSRKLEIQRRTEALIESTGSTEQNPSLLVSTLLAEQQIISNTINQQVNVASQESISTGDTLSENFNLFGNNRVLPLTGNYTADSNVTRAMMLLGAQRRIEDVRLNRDQNLFIVSDQYDENTDIRPFLLELRNKNYKVFQGTYTSVYEKCETAAKIPNFEFFCLSGDTVILVRDKEQNISSKYIKDFVDGDQVLSPDQNGDISWKVATSQSRNLYDNEKMFDIRFGTGVRVKASSRHRFLDENLKEICVEDITTDSKIGTAKFIPNNEKDIIIDVESIFKNNKFYKEQDKDTFNLRRNKNIPKRITLDEDFGWLLGMWVAEGSISTPTNRKNKNSRGYQTSFALHEKETNIADRLISIVHNKLNISGHKYVYKKYTRCTALFSNIIFTGIIESIFGYKNSYTKNIPSIIWSANSEIKKSFLSGLFVGDAAWNRRISLSSKSVMLLNDVHQLLLMLGIKSTICKYDKINIYGKNDLSVFLDYLKDWHHYKSLKKYCKKSGTNKNRKITDNKQVKSINEIDFNEKVYDLTVEDNHTFVIGSILTHNCNSQGHLEFRPPQWNRTPLSVLRRLFSLKNEDGINIMPDFLEDLFETKSSSIKFKIHELNIKIAIIALLLGKYPDRSLLPGMFKSGKKSLRFFGIKPAGSDSSISNSPQTSLDKFSNSVRTLFGPQLGLDVSLGEEGDILNGNTNTILGAFDPIFQEANSVFDGVLNASSLGGVTAWSEGYATPEAVNTIRDSFRSAYGEDPASGITSSNGSFSLDDFAYSGIQSDNISKVNGYFKELEVAVSNRDELVTMLNQVKKKQEELNEIESILAGEFTEEGDEIEKLDQIYNTVKSINDVFTGSANEGSLFDHLIEDDSRNLLGPGSGRRFIVNDRDIIKASFSETPPDFVRVNVYGSQALGIGPAFEQIFENTYYWAGATDFDLWRQYGYKDAGEVKIPYANNPETECRPFANLELQLQRAKINKGTITVVGNEYYEPGDTIYIGSKGLLYYIKGVSHTFDYGSSFTTQLELINGHPAGTYLPSPLDIIGQQVLKDDPTASVLSYRNIQGDDSYRALQPDGAIVFPPGPTLNSDSINVLLDYKDNMVRFTNMMIDLSSLVTGNRVVMIRGFSTGNVGDEDRVSNNMSIIKEMLINPQMITQDEPLAQNSNGFSNLGDDLLDFGSSNLRGIGVETGSSKGLVPMTLPNGLGVKKLSPEQIIEQKVTLGSDAVSEIKCINAQLQESLNSGDASILPKGGPKQRTWLDFRDDLTKVSNIIEIGILDIDRAIEE